MHLMSTCQQLDVGNKLLIIHIGTRMSRLFISTLGTVSEYWHERCASVSYELHVVR